MDSDGKLPMVRVDVVERNCRSRSGVFRCEIGTNLQFSPESLASYFFAQWEPVVFDALLLAAAVEFSDKVKKRPARGWTRQIELRVPVHDPDFWTRVEVRESLHDALQFLTGDIWVVTFAKRQKPAPQPQQGLFLIPANSSAVIPFSEGLDSRAVAGLMAKRWGNGLVRIRLGQKTFDQPKDASGHKYPFTAVPYKVRPVKYRFSETSARSRGFKFALLSGIAAYLAKAPRIIVPESGQGALGPSLVPVGQAYEDYRNHPLFTNRMTKFLKALFGHDVEFEFPRLWFTKGETLREYVALDGGRADWVTTRSCWQDNRQVSVDGRRRQCGICAACMLRRLSVHAADLSERSDTYIWENLSAKSFDAGAAPGFKQVKTQHHYAIAGALHLDHLAALKHSSINAQTIRLNAFQLARVFNEKQADVQDKLNRLLSEHEKEWKGFMKSLGAKSFLLNWIEQAR